MTDMRFFKSAHEVDKNDQMELLYTNTFAKLGNAPPGGGGGGTPCSGRMLLSDSDVTVHDRAQTVFGRLIHVVCALLLFFQCCVFK